MTEPHRLRWLHRIGYVTTIIVAAEIAFVANVAGYDRYRDHVRLERNRANTVYGSGAYVRDDHMPISAIC